MFTQFNRHSACFAMAVMFMQLLYCSFAHAEPIQYSYQVIAKSGDTFGSQGIGSSFGELDLNNSGVLVSSVSSGAVGSAQWVLKYNSNTSTGQVISQAGDTAGGLTVGAAGGVDLQINSSGQVLFRTDVGGQFAVLKNTGGASSIIVRNGDVVNGSPIGILGTSINDSGEVVYNVQNAAVVGSLHSTTRGLLVDGAVSPHNPRRGRPDINNNGDLIVGATTTFPGIDTYSSAITVGSGGAVTEVARSRTFANNPGTSHAGFELFSGPSNPVLNDNGDFAFHGTIKVGGVSKFAILTNDSLVARAGGTVGGKVIANTSFHPSGAGQFDLNNQDQVAWAAKFTDNSRGVFVGAQQVAATGDTIQGQTLTNVHLSAVAINDSGQVLFGGTLGSGFTQALILATPIVQDFAAAFTAGSPAILTQTFSQTFGAGMIPLSFDYLFESITGTLQVLLDGMLLDTINAPATLLTGLTTHNLFVDETLFPGATHELRFIYNGPTGTRMLLDNVNFVGITNGDFQTGSLDPWVLDGASGGTVTIEALSSVPEPSSLLLLAILSIAAITLRQRTVRSRLKVAAE